MREIAGVDPGLASFWSSRRLMIDERRAELAAQFQTDQGRTPTAIEAIALAQQATLETRQAKHEPRSLAEQRATWATEATGILGGGGIARMLTDVAHAGAAGRRTAVTEDLVASLASAVLEQVSTRRSVWNELHVRAEADRQVRAAGVDPHAHVDLVDRVVTRVLEPDVSVALNPAPRLPAGVTEPVSLQRSDGASQYSVWASTLYTSEAVLAAEARIVAAAGRHDGRRIDATAVAIALLEQEANGPALNTGQAQLVETFATSGARVQLALAPAGTGKTTAMRVLTRAWTSAGGTVVGLSPTAAAANELAASIGQYADTLDKLVWHLDNPDRAMPTWMAGVGAGSLVIIDEAGLASTRNLDSRDHLDHRPRRVGAADRRRRATRLRPGGRGAARHRLRARCPHVDRRRPLRRPGRRARVARPARAGPGRARVLPRPRPRPRRRPHHHPRRGVRGVGRGPRAWASTR